jgi:hypothetical protein
VGLCRQARQRTIPKGVNSTHDNREGMNMNESGGRVRNRCRRPLVLTIVITNLDASQFNWIVAP